MSDRVSKEIRKDYDKNHKISVISLFAGCGGSACGYRMAGFRVLLANDFCHYACKTLGRNFPETVVVDGDIQELDVSGILDSVHLKRGELDILDGSPPCQGFSISGKRIPDDPRNFLYRKYVELLAGIRPKVFVMENVPSMLFRRTRKIFDLICSDLTEQGYAVCVAVMDSSYYGVPQKRRRLIFIGIDSKFGIKPSFPKGENYPMPLRLALDGIENDVNEITELKKRFRKNNDIIRMGKNHTKNFNTILVHPDKPSPVVCCVSNESGYIGLLHWKERRTFTIKELKIIMSFPDDFVFDGEEFHKETYIKDRKNIVTCLGNAVPPLLMKSLALHMKKTIFDRIYQ